MGNTDEDTRKFAAIRAMRRERAAAGALMRRDDGGRRARVISVAAVCV